MTVINRSARLQGQPGAAGIIGVKGQKVSETGGRRSTQCLGLFVLHRVCSQEAEGGKGGGNTVQTMLLVTKLPLIFSPKPHVELLFSCYTII